MLEENVKKLSVPLQVENETTPAVTVQQVINTTDKQLSTNLRPDNEPTVGVNPNNPLSIVAASHAYGLPNGFPQFGVYRSTNGGSTFTTSLLPVPTGFDFLSDPVIDADLHNRYILSGIAVKLNTPDEAQIIVYRSIDDGQTFSNAIIVSDRPASGIFDDKPFSTFDKTPTSPFEGNAYISYTRFTDGENNSQILFQRSTNGGLTWSNPAVPITPIFTGSIFVQGSNVQVGPNGEVYVAWIEGDFNTALYRIRRSDDGGLTFGPTVTVSPIVRVPFFLTSKVPQWAFRVPTFAFLAVDTSRCFGSAEFARVYAVWQDFDTSNAHIVMSFSDDGGATWTTPKRVDDSLENTQNFFPFSTVSSCSGTLSVIYYTNRESSPNLDVFASISTDGGTSFTNSRITNVSSNPNGTFGNPAIFIGDYIFSTMIPPSLPAPEKLIAVWTDFRTGNQDIFANISDLTRTPSAITCPVDISVSNTPGQCGAIVNYPTPSVSESCPSAIVSCSPPSGSFFPVGSTTVTCTATDPCGGESATCSFTVTVNDTEPPVIKCSADITVFNDPGSNGAIVHFTPSVSDNCPNPTIFCTPASGSFFPIGMTSVTCTATDASGNTSTCSFNVTVISGTPQPPLSISIEQTVPLLLASIAFEELALAHIMNAEAEKLQFVLSTLSPSRITFSPITVSLADLFALDTSIQRTLRDVMKKEMLLEFKFQNVLDLNATTPPTEGPPIL